MKKQRRYGYFSDNGRENIITKPGTPRPWLNFVSNNNYGMIISQTGGGYSMCGMPDGNLVNPKFIRNRPGKYVYIRDDRTGVFWNINWDPVQNDFDRFTCIHGLGYTIIKMLRDRIEASLRIFVPLDENAEIWTISLKNIGKTHRRFSFYTYIEWMLPSHMLSTDDYKWYSCTEFSKDENSIICTMDDPLYPHLRYQAFMCGDFEYNGYECSAL